MGELLVAGAVSLATCQYHGPPRHLEILKIRRKLSKRDFYKDLKLKGAAPARNVPGHAPQSIRVSRFIRPPDRRC